MIQSSAASKDTQKNLVPLLRFSGFFDDWEMLKLSEIAKIERGRFSPRPRNDPAYYNGDIPFVQTADVVNCSGELSAYSQTLNEKGLAVSKLFPKGTILITIAANIGYTAILSIDMACPDSLIGLTCKKISHNFYLNQYLLLKQKRMDYLAPKGAQRNINIEFLAPFRIPHTSVPEQKKIADFLTAVDKKIQQLTRKKELLEQYKKGVMQKIFSQEICFKDKNGKSFPDWEEKKFREVFTRITNKNSINNQNVLTISAQQGLVNQLKYFTKSIAAKDVRGYYILRKGDFAYNKSYSKGYPMGAIKRLNLYDTGVVSTLYICFRIKLDNDASFYAEFLDCGGINKGIFKIAQEGARNHGLLNISVVEFFKDINLPRPHQKEQKIISQFIKHISQKILVANNELLKMQEFKKGLLQQLFV